MNRSLPFVSIIFAAQNETQARVLMTKLKSQQYPGGYEFCYSTDGNIAHAMNQAIKKSTGDLLVFTETDVEPATDDWVYNLVMERSDGNFVKSLEVNHTTPNFSGMIVSKKDLRDEQFDEAFNVAEDTEFYARMHALYGMNVIQARTATHLHLRSKTTQKALDRAYEYGRNEAKIMKQYKNYPIASYTQRQYLAIEIANKILKGIHDELSIPTS